MTRSEPKTWNIETSLPRLIAFTMGDELTAMASERDDIVVLTADLMYSNGTQVFKAQFPNRFYNVGIAEQNMLSIAAGMATTGFIPYAFTFASFASLLGAEQLRTDLAYPKQKVRVIGHHAGVAMGFYGASHHAVEDLAITRSMANMTVASPCDGAAIRSVLRTTVDIPGPVYIRSGRGVEAVVYDKPPQFEVGRFFALRDGSDATVIATGTVVRAALDAADKLHAEGISIRVLDAVFVKPIDKAAILDAARDTGSILTVEEHNPSGGLGGAVAEVLAESGITTRFHRHSLPDAYALVAPPTHLYRHYGLDTDGIASQVRALLKRG